MVNTCGCDPICSFPSDSGCGYEGSIAYCPLHAAAPALLEALEAITKLPGFEPTESYGVQARAAIAQAKGEK